MRRSRRWRAAAAAALLANAPLAARAQEGGAPAAGPGGEGDLAKQLSNPVSSLVSIPFQLNWEFGAGEADPRVVVNFQPVMPFRLSGDWNFIVRAIAPLVSQPPLAEGGETRFGIGDLTVETFLTPAEPESVVWGIGPVLALPMTTDPALGTGKWSAGPALVVLHQGGAWTVGALATQLWSYAGEDGRDDVDQTLLQPFLSYAAPGQVTLTLNAEASGREVGESGAEWSIPLQAFVSKIVKLGRQPLSVQLGGGWFVQKPDGGPDWRLRSGLTLLVPAK